MAAITNTIKVFSLAGQGYPAIAPANIPIGIAILER